MIQAKLVAVLLALGSLAAASLVAAEAPQDLSFESIFDQGDDEPSSSNQQQPPPSYQRPSQQQQSYPGWNQPFPLVQPARPATTPAPRQIQPQPPSIVQPQIVQPQIVQPHVVVLDDRSKNQAPQIGADPNSVCISRIEFEQLMECKYSQPGQNGSNGNNGNGGNGGNGGNNGNRRRGGRRGGWNRYGRGYGK